MNFEFTLCPKCRGKYLALRQDSTVKYAVDADPFRSLVWPDEHPDRYGHYLTCCAPCQQSIRLLVFARTHLWRYGELPAPLVDVWTQAKASIPEWPGFQRLSLHEDQVRDLERCRGEMDVAPSAALEKSSRLVQYLEERTRNEPGLVRAGAVVDLGLHPSGKSRIIQCPKCKEFVDADTKRCRFCNSDLDSTEIDTAVSKRAQEQRFAKQKELDRLKVSGWLGLIAIGILFFVPAVGTTAGALKWGVVLLFIGLSLAYRLR